MRSCVLRYARSAVMSSSSLGSVLMLGPPANGFTVVASENVDIGRCIIPGAIGGANPPCDPCTSPPPPYMFIIVFRGTFGIIPYMLPVPWYGIGAGIAPP